MNDFSNGRRHRKARLVSAKDLSAVSTPDTQDIHNGNLRNVAWSTDGRFLYAAGSYQKTGQFPVRRWADSGRGAFTGLPPGPIIRV